MNFGSGGGSVCGACRFSPFCIVQCLLGPVCIRAVFVCLCMSACVSVPGTPGAPSELRGCTRRLQQLSYVCTCVCLPGDYIRELYHYDHRHSMCVCVPVSRSMLH